jgi:Protein of unknown function (DUF1236)
LFLNHRPNADSVAPALQFSRSNAARGNKVEGSPFLRLVGNGAGNLSEEVSMRTKLLMISTAALLAGTLAAAAQEKVQPGGGAQEKAQPGSSQAPKGGQAQRNRNEDRPGQAQREQDKGQTQGQAQRDQDKQKGQTQGQAERDQDKKGQTPGQAGRDQDKKVQTQGQAQEKKGQTEGQAQRDQDKTRAGETRDQDRVRQGEREGQRSGGVSVSFTTEQRTKIRETVFKGSNAPRVSSVNFSINVGTVVPRTVRIIEVPEVIVDVHPEWRGYRYFIVNEELVIVEPDTLRIVAVIEV